ncbi:MAG: hypothetical protein PHW03_05240 [Eubacteriales bacterium]|nr:hypothetical protein [Eubacteriales bacterium]
MDECQEHEDNLNRKERTLQELLKVRDIILSLPLIHEWRIDQKVAQGTIEHIDRLYSIYRNVDLSIFEPPPDTHCPCCGHDSEDD